MGYRILEELKDSKVYRDRKVIQGGEDQYTVSIRKTDNRWACSCKGWIFTHNKKGTDCKHIEELKARFSNKNTVHTIVQTVQDLVLMLGAKNATFARTSKLWEDIRDDAKMLHFYYLNTPGKETEAKDLGNLIQDAVTKLRALALA